MIHGGPTLVDYDAWKETQTIRTIYTHSVAAFVLAPTITAVPTTEGNGSRSIAGGNYYDLEVPDIEKGVESLIARGLVDADKLGTLGCE